MLPLKFDSTDLYLSRPTYCLAQLRRILKHSVIFFRKRRRNGSAAPITMPTNTRPGYVLDTMESNFWRSQSWHKPMISMLSHLFAPERRTTKRDNVARREESQHSALSRDGWAQRGGQRRTVGAAVTRRMDGCESEGQMWRHLVSVEHFTVMRMPWWPVWFDKILYYCIAMWWSAGGQASDVRPQLCTNDDVTYPHA